jgi:hypothetical protein
LKNQSPLACWDQIWCSVPSLPGAIKRCGIVVSCIIGTLILVDQNRRKPDLGAFLGADAKPTSRARRNYCRGVGTSHSQAEFCCRAMFRADSWPGTAPALPPCPLCRRVPCFRPLLPRPRMYGPRRRRWASGHKVRYRLRRLTRSQKITFAELNPACRPLARSSPAVRYRGPLCLSGLQQARRGSAAEVFAGKHGYCLVPWSAPVAG